MALDVHAMLLIRGRSERSQCICVTSWALVPLLSPGRVPPKSVITQNVPVHGASLILHDAVCYALRSCLHQPSRTLSGRPNGTRGCHLRSASTGNKIKKVVKQSTPLLVVRHFYTCSESRKRISRSSNSTAFLSSFFRASFLDFLDFLDFLELTRALTRSVTVYHPYLRTCHSQSE